MLTPNQLAKLAPAAASGRRTCTTRPVGPADEMPPEYWKAVLADAGADTTPTGSPIQKQRLCDIQRHVLRVAGHRCGRTVEIQKADAVRLTGAHAVWGRHEEDGCWLLF